MAYDINANRGGSVIACAIVFLVLCSVAVALRFISHRAMRRPIFVEDWMIIPAWIMMMGLCANLICSVVFGYVGRHEEWVLHHDPAGMTIWSQTLLIMELLYLSILGMEKTSILLFYRRIFQIQRWFRWMVYGMIIYLWLWVIAVFFAAIFQCHPVAYLWDTSLNGSCFDRLAFYRWLSIPNLLHDVTLLVFPAPMVWRLQMPIKQKAALSGVFLVGSLGCVASAIRIYYFFKLNALSDDNWASVELMSWTCAEPGVILISACMPALWPLLKRTCRLVSTKYGEDSGSNDQTPARRSAPWHSQKTSSAPKSRGDDKFVLLHDLDMDGRHNGSARNSQLRSQLAVGIDGPAVVSSDSGVGHEYSGRGINVRRDLTWEVEQGRPAR